MPELTLDAEHVYRLGDTILPSVTHVIKAAGLMGWMPEDEYYRQRGQYVHEAIRMYFKGTLDIDALSEGVRPYVDSALEYIRVTRYKPEQVELSLFSPLYRYCGTIDAWPLLDWKTGGKEAWHVLQMAAYYDLGQINSVANLLRTLPVNVHLRKDGKLPKVEPYSVDDMRQGFKLFASALSLYQWRKMNKLLKEE